MIGTLTAAVEYIFVASILLVKTLLATVKFNSNDATDALALALCHRSHRSSISHRSRIMA